MIITIRLIQTFEPKINFSPPLEDEIKHYLNCVIKRTKPSTDGIYAENIIRIIETGR